MSEINICGRKIGPAHKPFVIAEVGINHEGDINKALRMVDDAREVGCECVKFQCHIIEDEMIPNNVIPGNAKESIWDIICRCKLSESEDIELKRYVESKGMIYLSTPFSRAAANRLEKIGVGAFKIGSGECNNYPLIKHIAKFSKPIILSTGMNDIVSIERTVEILKRHKVPYAILHCTSLYPTPYEKVRLGALSNLREAFGDTVLGLSDHSIGNYVCFAAVALGASILEKHFTSDKSWPGPDVSLSINPDELRDLITGSEAIHRASGESKNILKEEQPTIDFAYASVVATKNIRAGENFTEDNIWVKRPGTGEIKAADYENILGREAKVAIKSNSQIRFCEVV
jgi:N-acetylneuraminate synthase